MRASHAASVPSAVATVDRPITQARGLPNEAYVSGDYFQQERDTLFGRTWTCIGFASDLPEGTYAKPVSMMGLPLLVLKDNEAQIRVFHNVCSHRGQLLVQEERPVRGVVRCPYHSWTYDLNGALKGTPHIGGHGIHQIQGFDCADHGLKPVRSEVWMDMVFINLSGDAPSFQDHISPLVDRWAAYWGQQSTEFERVQQDGGGLDIELAANWKLAVENYCESYHLPWVHPGLNSYSKLEDHYTIMVDDRFAGQGTRVYQLPDSADQLPQLDSWPKERLRYAEYVAVYPNVLLGLQVDHFFAMYLQPMAPNRTLESLRLYYVGDAGSDKHEAARHALQDSWRVVFAEDIGVVEGMQAGRLSPGFDGGVFSPAMDEGTHHFHKWAARAMSA